jgi:hypothetical protein
MPSPPPPRLLTHHKTVSDLLRWIHFGAIGWEREGKARPWFRGQVDAGEPLLPSVMRAKYDEFWMTTMFRLKAPAFGKTPETSRLDQWLFLMQHYGLPTRLLDWTESPLLATFFAAAQWLDSAQPERTYHSPNMAVWMLDPIELNRLSGVGDGFPNTWAEHNAGTEAFRQAFGTANQPKRLPLAIHPSAIDPRVAVQRSCFTIHGSDRRDLATQLSETNLAKRGFFKQFTIPRSAAPEILSELDGLGISYSTVYPDLSGLAKEFRVRFGPKRRFGRQSVGLPRHRKTPSESR